MRVLPYGDRAVLVEVDGHPVALRDALAGSVGIDELVPAARTLLVRFDPARTDAAAIGTLVLSLTDAGGLPEPMTATVVLPVRYDGPDLAAIAEHVGASIEEVIELHAGGRYTVAFCGFAPGFAYLTGLDPRLHVGRLASPRTVVPAGAVAIAGEYTATYPRPSPGGWQLLGRTDAPLWDLRREPPALLTPGTRVRFEAQR